MGQRLTITAPRWHVSHRVCAAGGVHVVTCHLDPLGLPVIVKPSVPGFAAAQQLADALNRAYSIDPISGFDVSGMLGLAFVAPPAECTPPRRYARTYRVDAEGVRPIF
jgi:hypothetical protein